MAASIAALTAGGGGLQSTSDASGNLNLVSGTTTIVAMTSAGIAVTGTLTASGTTTLVTPALGTPASADFTTIAATQAQQEAGTALTAPVTPGRQQYHPSAAKAWVVAGSTGNILASHNISSLTDDGVGIISVSINVDMSSADYAISASTLVPSSANIDNPYVTAQSAGSFSCRNDRVGAGLSDPSKWFFSCFGDQ